MLFALALFSLTANPYLVEGRQHFTNLDFEAAASAMEIAAGQPGLSAAEQREAFDVWAQALLALGRSKEAEKVYARLLTADAYAVAPAGAPKVRECFERAKRSVWPVPSVKLSSARESEASVRVTVFDPWNVVKRVRWFEAGAQGLKEGPVPEVVERAFAVTPSAGAQRLLFDALGASDALLSHLEVELGAERAAEVPVVVVEPGAKRASYALTWLAGGASVVAAGSSAAFFYLGYRGAPALMGAAETNQWNSAASRNAALAWTFGVVALAAAVVAILGAP